jgi:sucrose phosphorylase
MASSENRIDHILYDPKPDYTRPQLVIPSGDRERMRKRLEVLYGEEQAAAWFPELERVLTVHHAHKPDGLMELESDFDPEERFTEKDVVMITYGDLLKGEKHSPLASLAYFLERPLKDIFNTIHILPFFPYSSDRGFSVTNFREVDPNLGTWQDIHAIGRDYKLLFDGVLNHASAQSPGFQEFLNGHPHYRDIVVWYGSPDELTAEQRMLIRRPRSSDVLTRFDAVDGARYVWTTFSPDQVDLNFHNPFVLLWVIETLLLYVRQGADIIRLDAVTYLWCELGTDCASLDETHEIIRLFRDVLDVVAPQVAILTETNVPHEENVSYFGNGHDEAQMVYNFALPPLVLHTFYTGDSSALTRWAGGLSYPSPTTTFFNMLDTHDGVGLQGAKGILSPEEIDSMIETARGHKAFVSYKTGPGGEEEPYEINTTWYGALNREDGTEPMDLEIKRYLASRSIALALRGVPGLYFHGMLGTGNDPAIVEKTGSKRDINRRVVTERELDEAIADPDSKMCRMRAPFRKLGEVRVRHRAFHPRGGQKVLSVSPSVFVVLRTSPEGDEHILAVTSVVNRACTVDIPLDAMGLRVEKWRGLLNEQREHVADGGRLALALEPYDVLWLRAVSENS